MKLARILSAALICVVAVAFGIERHRTAPYRHWETVDFPDGSFSLELPGAIKGATESDNWVSSETKPMFWKVGGLHWTEYWCIFDDRPEWAKEKHPNPPDALTDRLLDSYRNAITGQYHGEVVTEGDISVQGYPACEVQAKLRTIKFPENSSLDLQIIVVDTRVYFLMVKTFGHDRDPAAIRRFFDSFRIKTRAASAAQ